MGTKHAAAAQWSASQDFTQGAGQLRVKGECTFPTTGYKVTLKKKEPQESDSTILVLEKIVTEPTGATGQIVSTIPVEYSETTDQRYTQVQILPDQLTIPVKQIQ